MDNKIAIDRNILKVVSSDSRVTILKLLGKRKRTLSDLSRELGLSNPTVKEHLDLLLKAGLIKKEESTRKWKYYSITSEGKQLFEPTDKKLFLALVLTFLGAIIICTLLFTQLGVGQVSKSQTTLATDIANQKMAGVVSVESTDSRIMQSNEFTYASGNFKTLLVVICIVIAVVLGSWILYGKSKRKKQFL